MNKSQLIITSLALLGLTTFLSGHPSAAGSDSEHANDESWSFKEGHGIHLSHPTQEKLGLIIEKVAIADIQPEHTASRAQVYRVASEKSGHATSSAFAWLPAAEAKQLTVGQSLGANKSGFAENAKVTAIKTPLNTATTLVEVLVEVPDPKGLLRVGDFLQLAIKDARAPRKGVAVVQASAVIESIRGPSVYVLNDDCFLRTPVQLGARQEDKIEVTDGLFEGDRVVTQGAPDLWSIELQAVNGGKGCADGH